MYKRIIKMETKGEKIKGDAAVNRLNKSNIARKFNKWER